GNGAALIARSCRTSRLDPAVSTAFDSHSGDLRENRVCGRRIRGRGLAVDATWPAAESHLLPSCGEGRRGETQGAGADGPGETRGRPDARPSDSDRGLLLRDAVDSAA